MFLKSSIPYVRKGWPPRPGPLPPSNNSLAGWSPSANAGPFQPIERETGETAMPVAWLREELSMIKGIGPATADAIILLALKRPSYPVDRASFRVLVRHGWIDSTATYDDARDLLVNQAERADDVLDRQVLAALSGFVARDGTAGASVLSGRGGALWRMPSGTSLARRRAARNRCLSPRGSRTDPGPRTSPTINSWAPCPRGCTK